MFSPPSWSARPALAACSVKVPSPLLWKNCIGAQGSKLDLTTSKRPLFSKSSTMIPPAIENVSSPAAGGTAGKTPTAFPRRKTRSRNQIFRRIFVGVLSQRHVCEVKQPLHFQLVRLLLQVFEEVFNRLFG